MKNDYGAHCEHLAGYGVGAGELRDYDEFEESDATTRDVPSETGEDECEHKYAEQSVAPLGVRCVKCGHFIGAWE